MDFFKQLFEPKFKGVIFGALVEFAQEIASCDECVIAEVEGGEA